MSDIYKVNSGLPTTTKIELVNDQVLSLNGIVAGANFDKNEIDQIFSDLALPRKFLRRQGIGNSSLTYTDWSHLKSEDGYSIWKFSPTNYVYNSLNNVYFDGKLLTNKGEATSELANTFDYVFVEQGSGPSYTDVTSEANSEGGTAFSMMDSTDDYVYFGSASKFYGIKLEFYNRGSYYNNVVQVYTGASGDGWVTLTVNDNVLSDGTSNFQGDGNITWDSSVGDDWTTTAVNGQTKYWIRISTSQIPNVVAECYYATPANSVPGLLALSTNELFSEEWAFCSYGSSIYVTIRNTGNTAYEGNFYVTSSSSVVNKKNFFVYNHQFTADYEDSGYAPGLPEYADNSAAVTAGLSVGNFYRTGDIVKVVH